LERTATVRAAKTLAAQPDLTAELAALQAKGARLGPLLRLLLSSLAAAAASPDEAPAKAAAAGELICDLARDLDLDAPDVEAVAASLLEAGAAALPAAGRAKAGPADGGPGGAVARVCRALQALDLRHPQAVDAAVNAALGEGAAAAAAPPPAAAPGKGKKGRAAAGAPAGREGVFELVQRCFAGSSHAAVAGGAGGSAQTLAVAVHAPAEGVRIMVRPPAALPGFAFTARRKATPLQSTHARLLMHPHPHPHPHPQPHPKKTKALEKLDEVCSGPAATPEARELLASSILAALAHDAFPVATAAAGARGVADLPAADLLTALRALLARAEAAVGATKGDAGGGRNADEDDDGGKSASKAALKAAKKGLAALAALARRAPEAADACAAAALELALSDKRRRRLARAAVAACEGDGGEPWHPLLAPLVGVAGAGDEEDGGGKAAKKAGKRGGGGDDGDGEDAAAAAGARRAAVVDANRAAADALAQGLLAGGPEGWAAAGRVLAASGPRARHLLLLALARAVALLGGRGARGGRPRGGKASGGGGDAAAFEGAARCLVTMLPGGGGAGESRQLPPGWEDAAGALLDEEGLPTAAHASAAQSAAPLAAAHGAVLLRALYGALDAAPAPALAAAVGQPEGVFALLARHAYPTHPAVAHEPGKPATATAAAAAPAGDEPDGGAALAALEPHLRLLVSKTAAGRELEFLEGFYGLPREASRWYAQAAALQLLASDVAAAGAGGGWLAAGAARGGPSGGRLWLARLLGAAGSGSPQVRAGAARLLAGPAGVRAAAAALAPGGGALGGGDLAALCEALTPHAALLRANPRALALLVHAALAGGAAAAAAASAPPAAVAAGKGGRSRARGKAAAGAAAAAAAHLQNAVLGAPEAALAGLEAYLLECLPALGDAEALPALAFAAAALPGAVPTERLFAAAAPLLAALLARAAAGEAVPYALATPGHAAAGPPDAQAQMQALSVAAAAALLRSFAPECVAAAPTETLDAVLALLEAPALAASAGGAASGAVAGGAGATAAAAPAALRAAALQLVTPAWFAALPDAAARRAFRSLLLASAADADAAGRALARAALEALPVNASALLPLLAPPAAAAAGGGKQPRAKRARGGGAGGAGPMDVDGSGGAAAGELSDLAVSALELLQWKDVAGAPALVAPLHALLAVLLPRLGSIAVPHGGPGAAGGASDGDESGGEESGADGSGDAGDGDAGGSAAAGYACQLALLALRRLALTAAPAAAPAPAAPMPARKKKGAAAAAAPEAGLPEGFDVAMVLRVLAAAPDAALRNAALSLLEVLARAAPAAMLEHVLEVGWGWG
jgi:hypothetical protein